MSSNRLELRREYNRKCVEWLKNHCTGFAPVIKTLEADVSDASNDGLRFGQWMLIIKSSEIVGGYAEWKKFIEYVTSIGGSACECLFNEEPWITYSRWTGKKVELDENVKKNVMPAVSSYDQTVQINELLGACESYYTMSDIFNFLPNDITYKGRRGYLQVSTQSIEWSSLKEDFTLNLVWCDMLIAGHHDIFDGFVKALEFIYKNASELVIN